MARWSGVFPAVTTKLKEDGGLDVPAMQSSLERLVAAGVSGVIVLPMLGENASLTLAERETVIRAGVEAVNRRVPLLTGLAEISTEQATASARRYRSYGAEGLMAFPSLAYRTDPAETDAWYRAIAGAANLPVMIYNNPLAYGVDVTPAILEGLADVSEIVCIKEETGDVRRVTDLYNALGDRYAVFCGIDDLIVESLAAGVTGWVSGMTNAWPAECVELFRTCAAGDFAAARHLQRILTPAFHLDTDVKLVQYIKLAEHLVCGAPEWVRAPRQPLAGAERERVAGIIRDAIAGLGSRQARAA